MITAARGFLQLVDDCARPIVAKQKHCLVCTWCVGSAVAYCKAARKKKITEGTLYNPIVHDTCIDKSNAMQARDADPFMIMF